MPIYEYRCAKCETTFDVLRSMSEADKPIACDECGSKKTKRALSKCYSTSGGKAVAGTGGGCGGGGNCSGCGGSCSHSKN